MPIIPKYPPSPKRVFALSTPLHMLMKFSWEIQQLKKVLEPADGRYSIDAHLTAAYFAFNAAVTGWHLSDWLWESFDEDTRKDIFEKLPVPENRRNSNSPLKRFQDDLKSKSKSLTICCEIANGSKHMAERVGSTVEASLEWEFKGGEYTVESGFPSPYKYILVIKNENEEMNVLDIFDGLYKFWLQTLREWGFVEPEFIHPNFADDEELP